MSSEALPGFALRVNVSASSESFKVFRLVSFLGTAFVLFCALCRVLVRLFERNRLVC